MAGMPSELPIPIQFELPEQWQAAEPDAVGAPDAAYVALRPEPTGDFVANITVSGELDGGGRPLSAIADESLQRLQEREPDALVLQRTEFGSAQAPGLTQVAALTTDVQGTRRELLQVHVFLSVPDRQAVIELVLTSPPGELDELLGDFQALIASVEPVEPA